MHFAGGVGCGVRARDMVALGCHYSCSHCVLAVKVKGAGTSGHRDGMSFTAGTLHTFEVTQGTARCSPCPHFGSHGLRTRIVSLLVGCLLGCPGLAADKATAFQCCFFLFAVAFTTALSLIHSLLFHFKCFFLLAGWEEEEWVSLKGNR